MVKYQQTSPAKINLMLRVLGLRNDGYHELQTLFQILDWGDEIIFEQVNIDGSCEIDICGFGDLTLQQNLIYKAAQKLKPYAKNQTDWKVVVTKRIPLGAGLGGGSSNAATTLKFLNKHWNCELSESKLMEVAQDLGADVPVFIGGRSALATGIGEKILPMKFETPYILLVFPEISIATASLFGHRLLNREQQILAAEDICNHNLWINDFFPLLLNINKDIAELYQQLKKYGQFRLSGTGSTMFALFDSQAEAEACQRKLRQVVKSEIVEPLLT